MFKTTSAHLQRYVGKLSSEHFATEAEAQSNDEKIKNYLLAIDSKLKIKNSLETDIEMHYMDIIKLGGSKPPLSKRELKKVSKAKHDENVAKKAEKEEIFLNNYDDEVQAEIEKLTAHLTSPKTMAGIIKTAHNNVNQTRESIEAKRLNLNLTLRP